VCTHANVLSASSRAIEIAATKFTKSAFADSFLACAGWLLCARKTVRHIGPWAILGTRFALETVRRLTAISMAWPGMAAEHVRTLTAPDRAEDAAGDGG